MNTSLYKALMSAVVENDFIEYENCIVCHEHEFSERFNKKMRKILIIPDKIGYSSIKSMKKRIAVIIAVIILLCSLTATGVEPFRDWISGLFISSENIKDGSTGIAFIDGDVDKQPPISSVKDDYKQLSYLPAGYEIISESRRNTNQTIVYYSAKDKSKITFKQKSLSATVGVNTENAETKNIILQNSLKAFMSTINNQRVLVWSDNKYSYILYTDLSESDTICIANSVKSDKK